MTIRRSGFEIGGCTGAVVELVWHDRRVRVSGELDAYSAPGFVAAFVEGIEGAAGCGVAVDCSSLRFVDASGLSALMLVARHVRATGLGFDLADPGRRLERLMELCSLREL